MSRSHLSRSHSIHRSSSLNHRHGLGSHAGHSHSGIHSHFHDAHMHNHRRAVFRHRGISGLHAFTVGRATGININGSARGSAGAALHRSRHHRNLRYNRSFFRRNKSNFTVNNNFADLENMDIFNDLNNYMNSTIYFGYIVFFFVIIFFIITLFFMFTSF